MSIIRTLALAGAVTLAVAGTALAQTPAGGGVQGNMNNPGSVKSNTQKATGGQTGMMGRKSVASRKRHRSRRSRI